MQQRSVRRSNRERSEATRAALMEAARRLFVEKTFAETGTPEIVTAAGVTRGALYHHFADKQALFDAVAEAEAGAVAAEIETATPSGSDAMAALIEGGRAFLTAMARPGRTRLLLLDGPAVLGRARMDEIDASHGNRTLREGLSAAMKAGLISPLPVDTLATLLAATFDRAALAIETGTPRSECEATLERMLTGLKA